MINGIKNGNGRRNGNGKTNFPTLGTFGKAEINAKAVEADRLNHLSGEAARIKKFLTNFILTSQSDFDFARLLPHLETVSLKGGEHLHSAGEQSRYVYFPETAVISNLYTLADGNTIEVAMIGREGASEMCAVFGAQPPAHWTQVAVGGAASRIRADVLSRQFAFGGKIQTSLLGYVNSHITQISQRVACKSFHIIEKRFCSWLLMLHDRVGQNQIAMTQEQISLFLGVHRPSVTLVAQALREKGLIDYSRGKIHILDRAGLESSACECYQMIRESLFDAPFH